jgi:S-adenosylmethionine/arginine decarboxylase-like enzyme
MPHCAFLGSERTITFGSMKENGALVTNSEDLTVLYRPGLHVLVDGDGLPPERLMDLEGFQRIIGDRITALGLVSVGAVHHAFPDAGYTSVVCLTESHLSIHTWPEHGRVTFDVFLSNHSRDNSTAVEDLVRTVREWLGEGEWNEHRVSR